MTSSERNPTQHLSEAAGRLVNRLSSALPDNIILSTDVKAFETSVNAYWAKQECEVVPSCVIYPKTADQLSTAIAVLKGEYDERKNATQDIENTMSEGLFAIRSGGHSPVAHAASIKHGVLIDMSHFSDVIPSEDESSVAIGAGAKWGKVFEILDAKGLAVAGGRNSAVGVGGLVLGGKSDTIPNCPNISKTKTYKAEFLSFLSDLV